MPRSTERVTTRSLRRWPLPPPGESKYSRGDVVVIGGAAGSPGAAILAGRAALRAGAGRLRLAVAESVAAAVAAAVPEAAVVALAEDGAGHVAGGLLAGQAEALGGADAVLVGPGLDDLDQAEQLLLALPSVLPPEAVVVIDAFALGALPQHPARFGDARAVILTPNKEEAAILLGREVRDLVADVGEIAERYRAVVSCYGVVAAGGTSWRLRPGPAGLGTSGSGDVASGIVTGLAARHAEPAQAAVWGARLHNAAGERAAEQFGPLGYLASDLLAEIPRELAAIEGRAAGRVETSRRRGHGILGS